jgi:hypothetical protein
MKYLITLLISISLMSCSSKREAPEPRAYEGSDYANPAFCTGGGIECIAIWGLIYGSIATVRYIKNEVSNLTKFSDSNPESIVLKCHVQTSSHDFVRPCGPFDVEVFEKSKKETRHYNLTGYDNQINLVKGRNRITIKILQCGLSQMADDVKAGDVLKLEFPPECSKEN